MDNPLIELKGIGKVYDSEGNRVEALRHLDLTIRRGEFVCIMGTSGSGKSTLMNILGCLDTPSSGRFMVDGKEAQTLTPDELAGLRNRFMGFVFQSFNLLPRTTALENVELPMLYGPRLPAATIRERATRALQTVGLGERLKHFPNQLSGGQQQRVAIARAIATEPLLILADEPTGNLDTRTSLEIMGVFQALHARGMTVIYVTHEPDIAAFGTRVLTFRDGRLVKDEAIAQSADAATQLAMLAESERAA